MLYIQKCFENGKLPKKRFLYISFSLRLEKTVSNNTVDQKERKTGWVTLGNQVNPETFFSSWSGLIHSSKTQQSVFKWKEMLLDKRCHSIDIGI